MRTHAGETAAQRLWRISSSYQKWYGALAFWLTQGEQHTFWRTQGIFFVLARKNTAIPPRTNLGEKEKLFIPPEIMVENKNGNKPLLEISSIFNGRKDHYSVLNVSQIDFLIFQNIIF